MKQKLSDWASIAEIVSGFAVVISLVFLILGINENSEITRASMYANAIESLNELENTVMDDPDLLRVLGAFASDEASNVDFEGEDETRLMLIVGGLARRYDMAFSMEKYGLFGENEWDRFQRLICRNYRRAATVGMTDTYVQIVSEEFGRYVEESC